MFAVLLFLTLVASSLKSTVDGYYGVDGERSQVPVVFGRLKRCSLRVGYDIHGRDGHCGLENRE